MCNWFDSGLGYVKCLSLWFVRLSDVFSRCNIGQRMPLVARQVSDQVRGLPGVRARPSGAHATGKASWMRPDGRPGTAGGRGFPKVASP